MFYSELLLTKEGPLAEVWLAANLERKLSKTQFLQSNISKSTQAIVQASSSASESESIALRLSGQLLYGVVKIYSRKAKYLLDDVSDILLKIKSVFKSSANTVTLPVNATIVPSMNTLILQDTVTQGDLLYQEPLVFDDDEVSKPTNFFATQVSEDPDESIEIPRNKFGEELDELPHDDVEIELDFDLDDDTNNNAPGEIHDMDMDMGGGMDFDFDDFPPVEADESIEVGRHVDDANLSSVMDQSTQGIELNFDQPLETIDDIDEEQGDEPQHVEPVVQKKKKRTQRPKPLGRKIVNDRAIELDVAVFSNTENIVDMSHVSTATTLENKRSMIDALVNDTFINPDFNKLFTLRPSKKQRLEDPQLVDDQPPLSPPELQSDRPEDEFEYDQGMDMDFDFGGEDLDRIQKEQEEEEQPMLEIEEEDEEEDNFQENQSGVTESTAIVERQIGELLENQEETTFTKVLEVNATSETPLAQKPKSEATRVFFEMLVLATGDKLKLQQNELFGEISITV